jgi:hypothetical protein
MSAKFYFLPDSHEGQHLVPAWEAEIASQGAHMVEELAPRSDGLSQRRIEWTGQV